MVVRKVFFPGSSFVRSFVVVPTLYLQGVGGADADADIFFICAALAPRWGLHRSPVVPSQLCGLLMLLPSFAVSLSTSLSTSLRPPLPWPDLLWILDRLTGPGRPRGGIYRQGRSSQGLCVRFNSRGGSK